MPRPANILQLSVPERKIWSHAAFATVYTVWISIVYFVQLTLVLPRLARGQSEGIEMFLFVPFNSFLCAVDILGYSFMSAATLFAAIGIHDNRSKQQYSSLIKYAALLGGTFFEPEEDNPMVGFRGASRYTYLAYAEGFALECVAMKRVRDEMGLTNVKLMIPFCRRVEESEKVLAALEFTMHFNILH